MEESSRRVGRRTGADQPKTLRLVPHKAVANRGKRSKTSIECSGSRTEWKKEHEDPVGKEILTEEATNQDTGSDAILERRESDRFGKGFRYAKKGNRDARRGR